MINDKKRLSFLIEVISVFGAEDHRIKVNTHYLQLKDEILNIINGASENNIDNI